MLSKLRMPLTGTSGKVIGRQQKKTPPKYFRLDSQGQKKPLPPAGNHRDSFTKKWRLSTISNAAKTNPTCKQEQGQSKVKKKMNPSFYNGSGTA
jgi:hypothetical protein